MGLERKEIEIPLNTAMSTNQSVDLQSQGSMNVVENFRYNRLGELSKRSTFTNEVECVPLAGSAYASTALHSVFARGREVAALSAEHGIVRYTGAQLDPHRGDDVSNLATPLPKYAPRACQVSRRTLERSQFTQDSGSIQQLSAAVFGSQMVLVWVEYDLRLTTYVLRTRVFDLDTGALIDEGYRDTSVSARTVSACTYTTGVVVTYAVESAAPITIKAVLWDPNTRTWSAPSNLTTNAKVTLHSVRASPGGMYFGFTDNTSGFMLVQTRTIGAVSATHTATHDALGGMDIAICGSIVVIASIGTAGILRAWVEVLGAPANVTTLLTLPAGNAFLSATATQATDQATGNGAWVFFGETAASTAVWSGAPAGEVVYATRQYLVTAAATTLASIHAQTHYHTMPGGSAFSYDGRAYCPMLIDVGTTSAAVATCTIAVVRTAGSGRLADVIARVGHDRATSSAVENRSSSVVVGNKVYIVYAGDAVQSAGTGQTLFCATLTFADGPAPLPTAQVGGATLIASGVLVDYDGVSPCEAQPMVRPVVIVDGQSGGGTTATIAVTAVCRWVDAVGRMHRSAPAAPVTITVAAKRIDVYVSRCPFTAFDGAFDTLLGVELYVTQNGGAAFFLKSTVVINVNNDWYVFSNVTPATGAEQALYSIGDAASELVSEPPPAFSSIARISDRVWAVDAEDKSRVWFSKPLVAGFAVEWNTANTLFINDDCEAVSDINGLPCVLGAAGVWRIDGDGPNALGSGSFSPAVRLPHEVSCVSATSVCKTPRGIVFRGRRSYHLLDTGFGLSSLSEPVDDLLRSTTDFTALRTVYDSYHEELRFFGEAGASWMFSLRENKWTTFDTSEQNPVDACVVDGRLWYLHFDAANTVYTVRREMGVDEPAWNAGLDPLSADTPFYRFDGITGLQRLWRVVVLLRLGGDVTNIDTMTITLALDGGAASQTFTWSGAELLALVDPLNPILTLVLHPNVQRCRSFSVSFSETCDGPYSGTVPLAVRPVFGAVPGSKMPKIGAQKGAA